MIYTGYFAKVKVYEEEGLQPISIAGKADFFKGPRFPSFAPRFEMFQRWKKGVIDNIGYTTEFRKHLNTLDKDAVRRFLTSFDKDIVLLCFEKPGEFCHRHIVADWIEENLGICVEEFNTNKKQAKEHIVEALKSFTYTKEDLIKEYCLSEKEIEKLLKDIEINPPEEFFLFRQKGKYSLENKKEFLTEYGVY